MLTNRRNRYLIVLRTEQNPYIPDHPLMELERRNMLGTECTDPDRCG